MTIEAPRLGGTHTRATGGGGKWERHWLTTPPAWDKLCQAIDTGDTATVGFILSVVAMSTWKLRS